MSTQAAPTLGPIGRMMAADHARLDELLMRAHNALEEAPMGSMTLVTGCLLQARRS